MALKRNEPFEDGYIPLDNSGNDYGGLSGMTALDRAALDAAGKSWTQANQRGDQEGMDAAHTQAEALRKKYGYSGGKDGSQYIPTEGGFSYQAAPSYASKYTSALENISNQIANRAPFSYNAESDPLYQQYKDSYTANGQRAMEDTLGKVSARTGGLASSYAASAGQQVYDQYMAALADKVPELRQLAYSMYQDEGDNLYRQADLLMGLESADYGKYQDALSQYNADRNFAYGRYQDDRAYNYQLGRDAISDQRYQNEWDYQLSRDAVADQRYQDEWDYQLQRDAVSDQRYQNEWDYQLGRDAISDQRYQSEWDYQLQRDAVSDSQFAQELALRAKSASSSGGSSGSGSGDSSGTVDLYTQLYQAGCRSVQDAYAALLQMGYNDTEANKISGFYAQKLESGELSDNGVKAAMEKAIRREELSSPVVNGDKLDYDSDEGIFTWAGRRYSDPEELLDDISYANITDAQYDALAERFRKYGFDLMQS